MNKTLTFGLTHLAVGVKDLNVTRTFYQQVFDMEVMYEQDTFLQLTTPGTNDILVFEKNPDADGSSGGIVHFGFRLRAADAIGAMEQKIRDAGGIITSKGEFVPGSPYIFFKDPDGYEAEVWYELI